MGITNVFGQEMTLGIITVHTPLIACPALHVVTNIKAPPSTLTSLPATTEVYRSLREALKQLLMCSSGNNLEGHP